MITQLKQEEVELRATMKVFNRTRIQQTQQEFFAFCANCQRDIARLESELGREVDYTTRRAFNDMLDVYTSEDTVWCA